MAQLLSEASNISFTANQEDVKDSFHKHSQHPRHSEWTLTQHSRAQNVDSTISLFSAPTLPEKEKKELVGAYLSMRFDIVDKMLRQIVDDSKVRICSEWWSLLKSAMAAYPSSQVFARQHLRVVLYESAAHVLTGGFGLSPIRHTELVLFFLSISGELAAKLLNLFPRSNWTEQAHAVAYHLEWLNASFEVKKAEFNIINSSGDDLDELNQNDEFEYFDWNGAVDSTGPSKSFQPNMSDMTKPTDTTDLEIKLKNSHWMSLRVRFETSWKIFISSKVQHFESLDQEMQLYAFKIFESIALLALHFEEFEYAWSKSITLGLPIKWSVLIIMTKVCKIAVIREPEMAEIWIARCWVLYKQVCDIPEKKLIGNQHYIEFTTEFIKFLEGSEDVSRQLVSFQRVYSDLIRHCSSRFFPITKENITPLVNLCWKFRIEPQNKWGHLLQKLFEIYVLHKYQKNRKASDIDKTNLFSSSELVKLLGICTTAGLVDEFKILQRDLSKCKSIEYVSEVRKGYSLFVEERGVMEIKPEEKQEETEDLKPRNSIQFDSETLEGLSNLIISFLTNLQV